MCSRPSFSVGFFHLNTWSNVMKPYKLCKCLRQGVPEPLPASSTLGTPRPVQDHLPLMFLRVAGRVLEHSLLFLGCKSLCFRCDLRGTESIEVRSLRSCPHSAFLQEELCHQPLSFKHCAPCISDSFSDK